MRDLSIKFRLRLIQLLVVIAILTGIVITHQSLLAEGNYDAEYHAVQAAMRAQLEEDRLIEVLRSDFYATLLAPQLVGDRDDAAWQNDIERLRTILTRFDLATLPAEVRNGITENVDNAHEIIGNLSRLGTLLQGQPANVAALVRTFDAQIDAIREQSTASAAVLDNAAATMTTQLSIARQRADLFVVISGLLTVVVTLVLIGMISRSIHRSINTVSDIARDITAGRLEARYTRSSSTEIGQLGACLNSMAEELQKTLTELRTDSDERDFSNQLLGAFEISDSEADVFAVVSRAMSIVSEGLPMEMLLADSSRAHLEMAAVHPQNGAPGCGVSSPNECMAVRRGSIIAFEDSERLDACPRLRGRDCGPVSATCVPINFMGHALGVLHTAGPVGELLDDHQLGKFRAVALHAGNRFGTVRAFERTQLQAATDSMTGLANRRSLEGSLRKLVAAGHEFTLVMADLDHFKNLNDTYGHQAGDRALKLFASVVSNTLRQGDIAARWGGEEFVIVLKDCAAHVGLEWTDRLRARMAAECTQHAGPAFTASFGIAHSSLTTELDDLQAIADEALYQSKEDGRDRATVGSGPSPQPKVRHETSKNAVIGIPALVDKLEHG